MPWFLHLCRTHYTSGSQHDVSCTKAVESLDRIIHIFYDSDFFLTAEAKAEVESHGLRFGRHVMWLAPNACRVRGVRTWHIIPKFHFFMHIVSYDMHLINPRYVQAYLEEGLVGKIADMYAELNASRAYAYAIARACDRGENSRKDAAALILFAAERATQKALDAIQLMGGNGYINEFPAGRLLRDAKLFEIGAGTSEIRRMLIGRELFNETR